MFVKPQKSLGQNFLIDQSVIDQIIDASDLKSSDVVLEIGPGKGILTQALARKAGKIIAVEIDQNLVTLLKNKFESKKNIEIIHGDILKIDTNKILSSGGSQVTNFKVIANLPYYITSPIIRLFLESENPPSEMILMVQKEVAERIIAGSGEMSILAISVQYYADAGVLFYVDKKAFDPVPEVDSAVIKITKHKAQITKSERDEFFQVVRAGFCAKRKTLANNLANSFHLDKKEVEEKLSKVGVAANARAQEISVKKWKEIADLF